MDGSSLAIWGRVPGDTLHRIRVENLRETGFNHSSDDTGYPLAYEDMKEPLTPTRCLTSIIVCKMILHGLNFAVSFICSCATLSLVACNNYGRWWEAAGRAQCLVKITPTLESGMVGLHSTVYYCHHMSCWRTIGPSLQPRHAPWLGSSAGVHQEVWRIKQPWQYQPAEVWGSAIAWQRRGFWDLLEWYLWHLFFHIFYNSSGNTPLFEIHRCTYGTHCITPYVTQF